MKHLYVFLASIALALSTTTLDAIILLGKTNTENITDPNTGVPFDAIGRITSGGDISGSAIHLGNGFMLTADHVSNRSMVTFDGSTFYNRDSTFGDVQVAPDVDLKIFKLTSTPVTTAVNLLPSDVQLNSEGTLVGWGVGRGDETDLGAQVLVDWGASNTANKRWGQNVIRDTVENFASPRGYTYDSFYTVMGNDATGLGDNEGAATLYDSGSGFFQEIGGTWYLAGVPTETTSIALNQTSSLFGTDVADTTTASYNYFVDISSYRSEILAIIPEPTEWALGISTIVFCVTLTTRRRLRLS